MKICICIRKREVYNAKDMSHLDTIPDLNRKSIYKCLRKLTSRYSINLFIIDLNQKIRDEIYCMDPNAVVIINPNSVISILNEKLINNNTIYNFTSKREAIKNYYDWQMDLPIGKAYYSVIKIIDYYDEEIFNYFDNVEILSEVLSNSDLK